MKYDYRHLVSLSVLTALACGGVASTSGGGDGDGDADRPRRPVSSSGDGDGDPAPIGGDGDDLGGTVCRPGEVSYCLPPPECSASHQECAPGGDAWGPCICDVVSGVGGTPGVPTDIYESDFISGGRGTVGTWDGYVFTASAVGSTIGPEILGSNACVSGTLGAGYEEWAMFGWFIAQDIDPETFEGGAVHAISPGGAGIEVAVFNNGGSGLRLVIQTAESGTESWCAPIPPGGGVIPWSDFRKECWAPGGEAYDGVTPISLVGVLTYAGSDTLPTNFDYCVAHLGPAG